MGPAAVVRAERPIEGDIASRGAAAEVHHVGLSRGAVVGDLTAAMPGVTVGVRCGSAGVRLRSGTVAITSAMRAAKRSVASGVLNR